MARKSVVCRLWYPHNDSLPIKDRICKYCGQGPDYHVEEKEVANAR